MCKAKKRSGAYATTSERFCFLGYISSIIYELYRSGS